MKSQTEKKVSSLGEIKNLLNETIDIGDGHTFQAIITKHPNESGGDRRDYGEMESEFISYEARAHICDNKPNFTLNDVVYKIFFFLAPGKEENRTNKYLIKFLRDKFLNKVDDTDYSDAESGYEDYFAVVDIGKELDRAPATLIRWAQEAGYEVKKMSKQNYVSSECYEVLVKDSQRRDRRNHDTKPHKNTVSKIPNNCVIIKDIAESLRYTPQGLRLLLRTQGLEVGLNESKSLSFITKELYSELIRIDGVHGLKTTAGKQALSQLAFHKLKKMAKEQTPAMPSISRAAPTLPTIEKPKLNRAFLLQWQEHLKTLHFGDSFMVPEENYPYARAALKELGYGVKEQTTEDGIKITRIHQVKKK